MKNHTAGPAYCAAAWPVSTKIPAPMMAPMPSVIRLSGVSARFSWCSPASLASARKVEMDLVAHKFMRDSVQGGDESTVQTDPRFARASDLSIETSVRPASPGAKTRDGHRVTTSAAAAQFRYQRYVVIDRLGRRLSRSWRLPGHRRSSASTLQDCVRRA